MKAKIGVSLHNRFDIVKNGEWVGFAENIVLNAMYSRLCNFSTHFVNIHFGTGAGTPTPDRTSLFSHLGTKAAVDEEIIKALPTSRYTRKITLNPEEYVGSTITEVGIAYGSVISNLITHAMIKDSEGNPLSISKTDLDVIVIYATVFISLAGETGVSYLPAHNNPLINYLTGGSVPGNSISVGESYADTVLKVNAPLATNTPSPVVDVANKKRTASTRFGVSQANKPLTETGIDWGVRLNMFQKYADHQVTAEVLGAWSESNKTFTLKGRRNSNIEILADGVVTTHTEQTTNVLIPNSVVETAVSCPLTSDGYTVHANTGSSINLITTLKRIANDTVLVGQQAITNVESAQIAAYANVYEIPLPGKVLVITREYKGAFAVYLGDKTTLALETQFVVPYSLRFKDNANSPGNSFVDGDGNLYVLYSDKVIKFPLINGKYNFNDKIVITPPSTLHANAYWNFVMGNYIVVGGWANSPSIHLYDFNFNLLDSQAVAYATVAKQDPDNPANIYFMSTASGGNGLLTVNNGNLDFTAISYPATPTENEGSHFMFLGNNLFVKIFGYNSILKLEKVAGVFTNPVADTTFVSISNNSGVGAIIAQPTGGALNVHHVHADKMVVIVPTATTGNAITANYKTKSYPKDENYVLDVTFEIQFGEGV